MRVYVAGPYTNGNRKTNILKARQIGDLLRVRGFAPFVPHLFYDAWGKESADLPGNPVWTESWAAVMQQCLQWVEACIALVRIPGESKGSDLECSHAIDPGVQVVQLSDLEDWMLRFRPDHVSRRNFEADQTAHHFRVAALKKLKDSRGEF